MADGVLLTEIRVLVPFESDVALEVLERASHNTRRRLERYFEERGAGEFVRVEVVVEPGSLKGALRVTITRLGALFLLYGGLRQSFDYLVSDTGYVAQQAFRLADYATAPISAPVTFQEEDGPVVAIAKVLDRYEDGLMPRHVAIEMIEVQLAQINDAKDREVLLAALRELLDERNPLWWDPNHPRHRSTDAPPAPDDFDGPPPRPRTPPEPTGNEGDGGAPPTKGGGRKASTAKRRPKGR